jgi:alpha-ketoglutarate-dependent taurine dioxygenase
VKARLNVLVEPGRPALLNVPELVSLRAAEDWLTDHSSELRRLRLDHGAVLLRGLPFRTPEEFALLRDRLITTPAKYVEKATPRSAYGNGVFTATDFPARRTIALHNENSYALSFPGVVIFGCLVAPRAGGATVLGDMRALIERLPADLVDRFRRTGWTLVRNYWRHFGLSWQEAYGTDDPAVVERYTRDNRIEAEWVDGRLRTRQTRSAVIRHPETGDESWFNHVAFWNAWSLDDEVRRLLRAECGDDVPYDTRYGDGAPISRADIRAINSTADAVQVAEPWRLGDLMIVDNIRMAHGREAYQGDRTVLVAMGDPVDRAVCEV